MSRLINLLIIHCAASKDGVALGRNGETAAQVIDRWHQERGFHRANPVGNTNLPSIGYHFVIDTDGTVLTGRSEAEIGAHCLGHNENSLGICLAGTQSFTPAQWSALKRLTTHLQDKYRNAELAGHNQFSNKICPGFQVPEWVAGDRVPLAGHIFNVA